MDINDIPLCDDIQVQRCVHIYVRKLERLVRLDDAIELNLAHDHLFLGLGSVEFGLALAGTGSGSRLDFDQLPWNML